MRLLFHVSQTLPMRCRSQEIVSLGEAILQRETYFGSEVRIVSVEVIVSFVHLNSANETFYRSCNLTLRTRNDSKKE